MELYIQCKLNTTFRIKENKVRVYIENLKNRIKKLRSLSSYQNKAEIFKKNSKKVTCIQIILLCDF